jgi:histidinol-phosphate aminotransferase
MPYCIFVGMQRKLTSSRRQFIETLGSSAAAIAARPLFSISTNDGYVHLCLNESPYGPSDRVVRAMRDSIADGSRYPFDLSYDGLKAQLGKFHGLTADNILVGTGSTEILKLCDDLFLQGGRHLVAAETTYDAVYQYAVNSRADVTKVPLTKDYRHDLQRMANAITSKTGLVFICNPNNPTATIATKDEMKRFMDRVPESVTVLVDEAYSHFSGSEYESAIRYVKERRNVVVARTFSKAYGLAGMRIGYGIARADLMDRMRPYGLDFNLSVPALAAAESALGDTQQIDRVVRANDAQRTAFYAEMKSLGFECIPSQANFVMVNVRTDVTSVIEEFAKRKILVGRPFPPMTKFLRVTLGNDDEMKRFFTVFRQMFRI